MIPQDDRYRMVEDELLYTAQRFTRHLHRAEYARLKGRVREMEARRDGDLPWTSLRGLMEGVVGTRAAAGCRSFGVLGTVSDGVGRVGRTEEGRVGRDGGGSERDEDDEDDEDDPFGVIRRRGRRRRLREEKGEEETSRVVDTIPSFL